MSTQVIKDTGNVEAFELLELSNEVQVEHCQGYTTFTTRLSLNAFLGIPIRIVLLRDFDVLTTAAFSFRERINPRKEVVHFDRTDRNKTKQGSRNCENVQRATLSPTTTYLKLLIVPPTSTYTMHKRWVNGRLMQYKHVSARRI